MIIERLVSIVQKTFLSDEISLRPYGSYCTQLLTPFSDVDISIQHRSTVDERHKKEMLQLLSENLKLCDFVIYNQAILQASVPVLKIKADPKIPYNDCSVSEKSYVLKLDIIVDNSDSLDFLSTQHRTTQFIQDCSKIYPTFFDIILFLKFLMAKSLLNDTYTGGLNAYGLCILLVAFLESKNLESSKNTANVFFSFLDFLCNEFHPLQHVVNLGYLCSNKKKPFQHKNFYGENLMIIDPTSLMNTNVTPNCRLFDKVLELMMKVNKFVDLTRNEIYLKIKPNVLTLEEDHIKLIVKDHFAADSEESLFEKIFEIGFSFN